MQELRLSSTTDVVCATLQIGADGQPIIDYEIAIGQGNTGKVIRIGSFLKQDGCWGVMTQFASSQNLGQPDTPYSNKMSGKVIKTCSMYRTQGMHKTWSTEEYPNILICKPTRQQPKAVLLKLNTLQQGPDPNLARTQGSFLFYAQEKQPILFQSGRFKYHEEVLLGAEPTDSFGFICSNGNKYDVEIASNFRLIVNFIKNTLS